MNTVSAICVLLIVFSATAWAIDLAEPSVTAYDDVFLEFDSALQVNPSCKTSPPTCPAGQALKPTLPETPCKTDPCAPDECCEPAAGNWCFDIGSSGVKGQYTGTQKFAPEWKAKFKEVAGKQNTQDLGLQTIPVWKTPMEIEIAHTPNGQAEEKFAGSFTAQAAFEDMTKFFAEQFKVLGNTLLNKKTLPAPMTAGMRIIQKAQYEKIVKGNDLRFCGREFGNGGEYKIDEHGAKCGVISGTKEALFEYMTHADTPSPRGEGSEGSVLFTIGGASAQISIVLKAPDVKNFQKLTEEYIPKEWPGWKDEVPKKAQFHQDGGKWLQDFVATHKEGPKTIGLVSFLSFGLDEQGVFEKDGLHVIPPEFQCGGLDKMLAIFLKKGCVCGTYLESTSEDANVVKQLWDDCTEFIRTMFTTNKFFQAVKKLFIDLKGYKIDYGIVTSSPGIGGKKKGVLRSIVDKYNEYKQKNTAPGDKKHIDKAVSTDSNANFKILKEILDDVCPKFGGKSTKATKIGWSKYYDCARSYALLQWKTLFGDAAPSKNVRPDDEGADWPVAVGKKLSLLDSTIEPPTLPPTKKTETFVEYEPVGNHFIKLAQPVNFLEGFMRHHYGN